SRTRGFDTFSFFTFTYPDIKKYIYNNNNNNNNNKRVLISYNLTTWTLKFVGWNYFFIFYFEENII
ncbi:MAG: hypothetical protein N7Q72_06040, partial [Spiroplasma sp. Tabriz.8]|nr:hypothetical protein [Spiroplasma sp. Tabriz.8]